MSAGGDDDGNTPAGGHPDDPTQDVLDIVGIGFGPSNLGLAIAVEEHNRQVRAEGGRPLTTAFVERQQSFGWHRGMLLDDATMQVSFLKDLVTMRNPASDFSFLAYLQSRGRLVEFINHKILFPLRIEFHDYLDWAAERFDRLVTYDQQVVDVEPVVAGGRVVAFDVVSENPAGTCGLVHRARNVAVAVGLAPSLPRGATLGSRVWHNLDLLPRAEAFPRHPAPRRFVVVGAGQSAAEVVAYLHDEFPTAEVCSVFSRYGYAPSDDTPFANRIFDPAAVDVYFDADDDVKRMLFDYHRNTNYSVVDAELIDELYRREYRERVQGARRLRMMNASRVLSVDETSGGLHVSVESLPTGRIERLEADALVYATGYHPVDTLHLLGEAGGLVERRTDGTPEVHRDYRLQLSAPADAAVYVQGGTEHSHGISSSLLSNVAVRTGEIVGSIADRAGAWPTAAAQAAAPPTPAPAVGWTAPAALPAPARS